jgi:hypothetical protein
VHRIEEDCHCDRTTSEMRGLSPKIISGDSRRRENAQTHTHKHTIPNMKFKLKLLQIKCHVLGFTKDKAQKVLQRVIRVFAEAFVSHDRHTLFTGRRRKILTDTQINKNNKSKSLSDYAQQDLSIVTRRPRILDMHGLK